MLIGCRKNEILILRWKDLDLDACEPRLGASKPGSRPPVPPQLQVDAFMLDLSIRAGRSDEGRPNPVHLLDSSPHPQQLPWGPVIVPKAVEFKLPTMDGFP